MYRRAHQAKSVRFDYRAHHVGRGNCNTFGATGQVVIGSYAPGENVTNSNPEMAFILVNLGGSNQQIPYYAERAVTVQAGVTYTYALKANQSAGSSVSQSCVGTYAVTLHAGTLP